ncbi:MAG: CvpA family protein [Phenylobacterium sp.]|uniref:CvpA family protein n=2 Tax=Phenylobacterium sp. TaxID=1871053 RepID=UPI0025ECB248|nr:CvpA family protein [Phenylobacterium sp.]MCA6224327.1 CvpA family protein [Phenylobacterium sp.]MCA6231690.1 CvpA family protein [Phenylobacterium sp.]MCA6234085.1 CvpA family protein [Phenylobacterium sp.]MCA6258867.1 CvpA family protein [Phenylobacterium sp.]MCA6264609.1 CvpA family protein [Phenylobacterium sp.]
MIPFDIILLAILLISAGLGYLQGALKELVSLTSLVLALAVAILCLRHVEPLVDARLNPDWAAPPLTFLLLFVGAYLGLRVAGAGLAGGIRQARLLNALDRAIGFAFGLVRATLFLGVCNLAFTAATPAGYAPSWLTGSLFYPLTARSADLIRALTPKGLDLAGQVAPKVGDAVDSALGDRHEGDMQGSGGYESTTPPDRDKAAETPW